LLYFPHFPYFPQFPELPVPFVYIVRCADDTLYTGWAKDVARRVAAHNCGRGARYTRTRGPVTVIYTEEVGTIGEALKRELAIKRYPRAKKLALAAPVKKKGRKKRT
jgi:putative endonuclease